MRPSALRRRSALSAGKINPARIRSRGSRKPCALPISEFFEEESMRDSAGSTGFFEPTQSTSALMPGDEDILASLFENWERFADAGAILPPISPLALNLLSVDQ